MREPGVVRLVNDSASYPPAVAWSKVTGQKDASYLIMYLNIEGNRLGALSVMAAGKGRFTRAHADLLLQVQMPFAIAMSYGLRFQEVLRLQEILADDNRYLNRELLRISGEEIVGADFGLREVMDQVRQVAPLDSPVLLLGETGVGKEVVANAIHYSSPRKNGPFIKVNCGAIPDNLVDSELFGHEKGAFTGAITQRRGRFERASGGTIFLDEVGELPPAAQVRLLRVLQEKEIERVGGSGPIPVDVRLISATHQDLREMVARGEFREDLWFRFNVFPITLPPLRQRKADLPALVEHFIKRKTGEMKLRSIPKLAPGAMERLQAYPWPGNVRELENFVERALIRQARQEGKVLIHFDDLPLAAQGGCLGEKCVEDETLMPHDDAVARHIRRALERTQGKIYGEGGAARILGLNPNTLRSKMQKLRIPFGYPRKNSVNP
jgi:transcriptional regulator with GAF, ATPase, and Fis domain